MESGEPRRSDYLLKTVYGDGHFGIARLGARVWDLKKKYNVEIKSWPDEARRTLTWYQLVKKEIPKVLPTQYVQPQLLQVRDSE